MARQKTKLSDRFGSGGNKDGSPEEKFFTDTDIQIDPEWKAMDLLRAQIDDITDTVNANDEASGSYAALKRDYLSSSGSFASNINTLTSASSSFAGSGGVKTLGVTAGSADAFPSATITGFSHKYDSVSRKHSLVISVTVTDERGRGKLLSTTLQLA